ncbi:hypothetical protein [uncultured Corynebacterium sp.]|uniref:hypothetical protein n=1 Tax=uncultured Corynebacterium sp. TaxID=159447 RepID=UPI0025D5625A|nr:hypothetical protein [uncultured Corynebacterium sp.]
MGAGKSAKQTKTTKKKAIAKKTTRRKSGATTAHVAANAAGSLRPVIIDISDPLWNNEARMVVAVTRRPMIVHDGTEEATADLLHELDRKDGFTCQNSAIVLSDKESDLTRHRLVRAIRVDQLEPSLDAGGAMVLAEMIGSNDAVRIAVSSAVGGAGSSLFAAQLAYYMSCEGRPAVLIDADPHSCGLDLVLGKERRPGLTRNQIPADCDFDQLRSHLLMLGFDSAGGKKIDAEGGAVPVIYADRYPTFGAHSGGRGVDVGQLAQLMHADDLVVDCGRSIPVADSASAGWEEQWGEAEPDVHVLVAPLTIQGATAASTLRNRMLENDRAKPLIVLREVPGASTSVAVAAMMMDEVPVAVIRHDAQCAPALDRGEAEYWIESSLKHDRARAPVREVWEKIQEIVGSCTLPLAS